MTTRQVRELEYHKVHAEKVRPHLTGLSSDVLDSARRRWWNHYWWMYDLLIAKDLRGKRALVVGCGSGNDAVHLARLGARVHAFDLSSAMIALAKDQAARESAEISFRIMSAEQLSYADNTFDVILVRDILHHCEVDRTWAELLRVSRHGSFIVVNEMYTHSILQMCRETRLGCWLQNKVVPLIYKGQEPYITSDERKLDEIQLRSLRQTLTGVSSAYFGMFVGRVLPDSWRVAAKIDRVVMRMLGSLGYIFAGRFLIAGSVRKTIAA